MTYSEAITHLHRTFNSPLPTLLSSNLTHCPPRTPPPARLEVDSRAFPSAAHSPYKIAEAELEQVLAMLRTHGMDGAAAAAEQAAGGA